MTQLFQRPEKPEVLSQKEIGDKVFQNNLTIFCGKCGLEINKIPFKNRQFRVCSCCSREKIIDSVGVFRIIDNRILLDMVMVTDDQFDPLLHSPPLFNGKRRQLFNATERKVS